MLICLNEGIVNYKFDLLILSTTFSTNNGCLIPFFINSIMKLSINDDPNNAKKIKIGYLKL